MGYGLNPMPVESVTWKKRRTAIASWNKTLQEQPQYDYVHGINSPPSFTLRGITVADKDDEKSGSPECVLIDVVQCMS